MDRRAAGRIEAPAERRILFLGANALQNGRPPAMTPFTSTGLKVDHKGLWVLDQTQLPQKEVWLESKTPEVMIQIIKELKVRGAPLIGVAAAMQLGLLAEQGADEKTFE